MTQERSDSYAGEVQMQQSEAEREKDRESERKRDLLSFIFV